MAWLKRAKEINEGKAILYCVGKNEVGEMNLKIK